MRCTQKQLPHPENEKRNIGYPGAAEWDGL